LVAMVIGILAGPRFIAFLRKKEFGQHIREELSERHAEKQGTPTIGGLLLVITVVVGFAAHHQHLSHDLYIPVVDRSIPLGPGWYVLLFLIIAGAVNGVNLTDGIDGLAAGT